MNSEEKPEKGEGREGVSAQPSQVWRLGPAEEGCQDRVHLVQDSGCPAPPQRHGSFWSDCCPVWSCMFNSLWHRHAGNSTWKAVAIWRCRVVGGLEAPLLPIFFSLPLCLVCVYTQLRSLQGSSAFFATLSARRRTCLSAICRYTSLPGCLSVTCATSS